MRLRGRKNKDKTTDDLIIYKRTMQKKYKFSNWTDIHQLYNDGLDVSYNLFSSENHFHNKKLKQKIDKEMDKLINKL